jgi:anthranilate synthase component 1
MALSIQPSLAAVHDVLSKAADKDTGPNLIPLSATLSAEFLTPSSIYLNLAAQYVVSRRSSSEWRTG